MGKAQTVGDADAMGVADHGRSAVEIAQEQICGFAAYAGELE